MRFQRAALPAALTGLIALTAYGILSNRLFDQPVWLPGGLPRLAWFAAGFSVVAVAICAFNPRWFRAVALAAPLVGTLVAAGPLALGAVALFLFSAYVLGRIAMPVNGVVDDLLALLLGAGIYATAIGLAAHFRINYASVYVAILCLPLALRPRVTIETARRIASPLRPERAISRAEMVAQAMLAFILLVHWLLVLKPEAGSDALAMHLTIPASIAQHHRWDFDFRHLVWAVMPMAGDWIYTAVYLPGGEQAARLLNLAMLAVLTAILYMTVRRLAGRTAAFLAAALFCSSPIVQLETGSLFVENFWAALLVGSTAALWRYRETQARRYAIAGAVLLGTAIATKLGAVAFAIALLPLCRPKFKTACLSIVALVLFAAPPYVNAYVKTGNPVFPFANAIFRSPYYETEASFADRRFKTPVSWDTPYALTIQTDRFLEGQKGALGFHYLLLLPLILFVAPLSSWGGRPRPRPTPSSASSRQPDEGVRRGPGVRPTVPYEVRVACTVAAVFFILMFLGQSNLRYVYPALALATVPIGWLFAAVSRPNYGFLLLTAVLSFALNIYFLPASGWYHKDGFINVLNRGETERYLAWTAPVRPLIDYLNREHAGAPAMLVQSSEIAGLRARSYSNLWHHQTFVRELLQAREAADVLRLVSKNGISHFIVPSEESGIAVTQPVLQSFLSEFTEPEHSGGRFYVAKLRSEYSGTAQRIVQAMVAPAGAYDDVSPRVRFSGKWLRDSQFREASGGTLTYSSTPGDRFRLNFIGTEVVYMYTRAMNRGRAEILIDGVHRATLDLYGPQTEWQITSSFGGLPLGEHSLEIRVGAEKNASSSGYFVDLDRLTVR